MRLRRRSIRVRILALVVAPMLALIGLYAFALSLTYGSYVSLTRAEAVHNAITQPTTSLQAQLDAERSLAMQYASRPSSAGLARFVRQQALTGNAVKLFNAAIVNPAVLAYGGPGESKAVSRLHGELANLPTLEALIAHRALSPLQILAGYTGLVTLANYVLDQSILQLAGGSVSLQANALIGMDQVRQTVLQENDLLRADLRTHRFGPQDRHAFAGLVAVRNALLAVAQPQLSPTYQRYFSDAVPPRVNSQLRAMELAVIKLPAFRKLSQAPLRAWAPTVGAVEAGFNSAEQKTSASLTAETTAQSGAISLRLILAGSLGLLAIIVAAGIAVLVGRGVIRQLSGLRQSALELADHELPAVIERLRAGEDVDVEEHVPPVTAGGDEIDQVRQAFAVVQRTAIEAAVDEARVRRGVNDVFRNLARRSQSLLSRQLALLDSLERRAQGPDELANLFRLDHLTTRMRRHAEGLLILAGGSSGRSWRDPVPVVDVLRASVAEVEDYTRFRVLSTTSALIAGYAVADVVHLLAELAENATLFSPVQTPVRVEGSAVARGVAVEIEDRGLGISDGDLERINAQLADPPQFDLSGSDQLGLFIAARLGKRHDIRITLRQSAYGGTTAVVLLPASLVVEPEAEGALPAGGPVRYIDARQVQELTGPGNGAGQQIEAAGTAQIHAAPAAQPGTGVLASLFAGDPPWAGFGRPGSEAAAGQAARASRPPWPDAEPPRDAGTGIGFFTGPAEPGELGWTGLTQPQDAGIGSSPATSPAVRPASTAQGPPWEDAEPPQRSDIRPGTGYDLPSWTGQEAAADVPVRPRPGPGAGDPADLPATRELGPANGDAADLPVRPRHGPAAGDAADLPGTRELGPANGDAADLPVRQLGPAVSDAAELPGARQLGPANGDPADLPVRPRPGPANGDQADLPGTRQPGPGGGGDVSDLPVRVRQANLAPQLRGGRAGRDQAAGPAAAPAPETVRNRMSAWQRGWERGRSVPASTDDAAPPPPEERT